MPNYEIVRKRCEFRKKEVLVPATYVSEPRGDGKLIRHFNDCLSKDPQCDTTGCRFCAGANDPFGGSA
jgi:hypothetical protein